eukprot:9257487-Ditylum_brightwellii.AAC.2
MGLPKSGSSSGAGYRQCSKDNMLCKDPHAMQLPRPLSKATAHVPQGSWADPEVLHAEEPMVCGRNDHQGLGSSSIRIEQTSWNMEYQHRGVESLPYRDLTQWTKG